MEAEKVEKGTSKSKGATVLPATVGMAATFDFELVERYGEVLAAEAALRGEDVVLAPAMGLPGEFSEDPFLTGVIGKHIIMGIQATGAKAAAVGFPVGTGRDVRERDLIPFEMAVKDGRVACVVGDARIEPVLCDEWGFTGRILTSDEVERGAGADVQIPEQHGAVARELASRAITLLRNERALLPLDPASCGRILIVGVGRYATDAMCERATSNPVAPAAGMRDVLTELGADNPVDVFKVTPYASNLDDAVAAACLADTVVVIAEAAQEDLLAAVLCANPRTVLVRKNAHPGSAAGFGTAPAVLECYVPGQEDGHAVADALFGNVTPSGKLPAGPDFGFGLSYTTFDVHPAEVTQNGRFVSVNVPVTNTGSRTGGEVAQVYADIPVAGQPRRRLVGFRRVEPTPGETAVAVIEIDADWSNHPFSVWDTDAQTWVLPDGEITLHIGTSLGDTPQTATVRF